MRPTQTFSVDFIVRKCKADKTRADIFARITVDGGLPKEISLKEQIQWASWDNSKEKVRGRTVEAKSINDHIENVRAAIKQKYRQLQMTGALITAETVKSEYLGLQSQLKGHTLRELLEYYKKIWEPRLKNGGFKNYKTTIDYLNRFLKANFSTGDVYLSQVNGQFATDFEHYIRTTPIKAHDPCSGNGVGKHIQRFKRILNWAEEDLKWIAVNQCRNYSCPLKKSKRKKLDMYQLVRLEQKTFAEPTLQYVKELFIYCCYTGLAFVDVMALSENDFEWEPDGTVWCKIYRTKSDEFCAVPLVNAAAVILDKYRKDAKEKCRDTIFPVMTNQYINDCLKIIQAACEIPTHLTFHVARHTFAKSVALKNGIPLETVQMMLGHTKITTTQIYAEVDEEKILNDMRGFDEKLEKKRIAVVNSLSSGTWRDAVRDSSDLKKKQPAPQLCTALPFNISAVFSNKKPDRE